MWCARCWREMRSRDVPSLAPQDASYGTALAHVLFENIPRKERDLRLYLPLYRPVKVLGIALHPDATIARARRFASAKPVVFYGTSITQGGCASRSGMSYP